MFIKNFQKKKLIKKYNKNLMGQNKYDKMRKEG